jgi:hypothetical protein
LKNAIFSVFNPRGYNVEQKSFQPSEVEKIFAPKSTLVATMVG